LQVLWAGRETANKWFRAGYRSLDDLRANPEATTHQQRVGLKYFDELDTRVTRAESAAVSAIVTEECQRLMPGSLCVLGGSYRRGQPTQADFDFILAPPPPHATCDLLPALYRRLKARGFLSDDLVGSWMETVDGQPQDNPVVGFQPEELEHAAGTAAADAAAAASSSAGPHSPPRSRRETSCSTYFGIWYDAARPAAVHRRIDLKCFTAAQAPYALIAWTGNTPLNVRLFNRYPCAGCRVSCVRPWRMFSLP
jgi:hypothetical protein